MVARALPRKYEGSWEASGAPNTRLGANPRNYEEENDKKTLFFRKSLKCLFLQRFERLSAAPKRSFGLSRALPGLPLDRNPVPEDRSVPGANPFLPGPSPKTNPGAPKAAPNRPRGAQERPRATSNPQSEHA